MLRQVAAAFTVAVSAFGLACGSDRLPLEPDLSALASVEVTPPTATIEPGSMVQLAAVGRDGRGARYTGPVRTTFHTSDGNIVTVTNKGVVTGIAPGGAKVTVRMTELSTTRQARQGSAETEVLVLPSNPAFAVTVTADPERGWTPNTVYVSAGGTVRWFTSGLLNWSGQEHRSVHVWAAGETTYKTLELKDGVTSHTFSTPGEYRYCSAGCWDPPDLGVVFVR